VQSDENFANSLETLNRSRRAFLEAWEEICGDLSLEDAKEEALALASAMAQLYCLRRVDAILGQGDLPL